MTLYLSLAQVLLIAEEVTGINVEILLNSTQIPLLDAAVAKPQSNLIGLDPYPEFEDKAAALTLALIRNHPLPDGNKRLAFMSLFEFCWMNGYELEYEVDDAEKFFFDLAAGSITQGVLRDWIKKSLRNR